MIDDPSRHERSECTNPNCPIHGKFEKGSHPILGAIKQLQQKIAEEHGYTETRSEVLREVGALMQKFTGRPAPGVLMGISAIMAAIVTGHVFMYLRDEEGLSLDECAAATEEFGLHMEEHVTQLVKLAMQMAIDGINIDRKHGPSDDRELYGGPKAEEEEGPKDA